MAEELEHGGGDETPLAYEKKERKGTRKDDFGSALNINSLMDIMTILLVFLLVSITNDPLNVKLDDFLLLAKSTANYDPQDAVPVTITKQAIIVDNKQIVKVDCSRGGQICQREDYKVKKGQPSTGNSYAIGKSFKEDGSESSFMIEPLHKTLEEIVKQQKDEAKELGREFKPVATIVCDREIPFRMIAEVVHTLGQAGLSDLRFAIMKTNSR